MPANDNIPLTALPRIDAVTPDMQKRRLHDLCERLPAEKVAPPEPRIAAERRFEKPDRPSES